MGTESNVERDHKYIVGDVGCTVLSQLPIHRDLPKEIIRFQSHEDNPPISKIFTNFLPNVKI